VGPDAQGNIEINIPGAAHDIIGDNKFAFVPKGHNYKIVGIATGLGHFNARSLIFLYIQLYKVPLF